MDEIFGIAYLCCGILFLLFKGQFQESPALRFSSGDSWMLLAAFCFAVYNILVRKKARFYFSHQAFIVTIFVRIGFTVSIFFMGT
jgi:drug/metabolite transporter (DMT)-like permease